MKAKYLSLFNKQLISSNIFLLMIIKSLGHQCNKLKLIVQLSDVPFVLHWVQDRFRVTNGMKTGIHFVYFEDYRNLGDCSLNSSF